MSRSTSSTVVGEVGRGRIGAGNKEQLTWWEAAARTHEGEVEEEEENQSSVDPHRSHGAGGATLPKAYNCW